MSSDPPGAADGHDGPGRGPERTRFADPPRANMPDGESEADAPAVPESGVEPAEPEQATQDTPPAGDVSDWSQPILFRPRSRNGQQHDVPPPPHAPFRAPEQLPPAEQLAPPAEPPPAAEQPPADEGPPAAEQLPAEEQPPAVEQLPADEGPPAVEQLPADEAPPVAEPPLDEAPVTDAVVDAPPADEPPADEAPVEELPTEPPPGDAPPADEPPGDEPPGDELPTEPPPVDEPRRVVWSPRNLPPPVLAVAARIPATYDVGIEEKWHAQVVERAADVAATVMPMPLTLLDVGCGNGALLKEMVVRVPYANVYVGLDPVPGILATARQATDVRVSLVRGAAEALPFADATFDLVLATMSFAYWADQRAGARQLARVVADHGKVVVVETAAGAKRRKRAARSVKEITELLGAAGLHVERVEVLRRSALFRPTVRAFVASP